MTDFLPALLTHYGRLGLFSDEGPTYAPTTCSCAQRCWAGEPEGRFPEPPPSRKGEAYRPWVGPAYVATRMVVVGESFNEHGGFDEAEGIVRWAMPRLARGIKRMDFDAPGYHGSLFQHRAALYAATWLAKTGYGDVQVGEAYEHIAFTNLVKCSPRSWQGARSRPNEAMWALCGANVLAGELRILAARRVVVLGRSSNSWAFRAHVWPDLTWIAGHGRVSLYRAPDGREALVVPHPASRAGAAWSILGQVKEALANGLDR